MKYILVQPFFATALDVVVARPTKGVLPNIGSGPTDWVQSEHDSFPIRCRVYRFHRNRVAEQWFIYVYAENSYKYCSGTILPHSQHLKGLLFDLIMCSNFRMTGKKGRVVWVDVALSVSFLLSDHNDMLTPIFFTFGAPKSFICNHNALAGAWSVMSSSKPHIDVPNF